MPKYVELWFDFIEQFLHSLSNMKFINKACLKRQGLNVGSKAVLKTGTCFFNRCAYLNPKSLSY